MYIYCQNMTFDTGHFLRLLSGTICAGDFTFNKLIFEHKIFSFTQVWLLGTFYNTGKH